ncbi:hypothetical protein SUGI_1226800, partial [Cryptomeria japonica]
YSARGWERQEEIVATCWGLVN